MSRSKNWEGHVVPPMPPISAGSGRNEIRCRLKVLQSCNYVAITCHKKEQLHGETRDTVPEIIDSGPMCIQNYLRINN